MGWTCGFLEIRETSLVKHIYRSFIRPILEYADVIWDNCSQQKSKNLKKFKQKQQELQQGPPNLSQYKKYTKKFAGSGLKRGDANTNLFSFTKCIIMSPRNIHHQ